MTVREVAVEAYREALPALGASLVGGLLAGVVLGGMRADLRAVEGLLVLVPALLATRGNVYGSLGARLATGLHQGLIEPRVRAGDRRIRAAASAPATGGFGPPRRRHSPTVSSPRSLPRRPRSGSCRRSGRPSLASGASSASPSSPASSRG